MRGSGLDDVACALQKRALGWFGIHGMQKQGSPRGTPGGLQGRGARSDRAAECLGQVQPFDGMPSLEQSPADLRLGVVAGAHAAAVVRAFTG